MVLVVTLLQQKPEGLCIVEVHDDTQESEAATMVFPQSSVTGSTHQPFGHGDANIQAANHLMSVAEGQDDTETTETTQYCEHVQDVIVMGIGNIFPSLVQIFTVLFH